MIYYSAAAVERTVKVQEVFLQAAAKMNRRFVVRAAKPGHAFVPVRGQDLDQVFSVQIERTRWRGTLAGCRVTICEHLDGCVSIVYEPHVVERYTAQGVPAGLTRKSPTCSRPAA